jgi:hypothetical protein
MHRQSRGRVLIGGHRFLLIILCWTALSVSTACRKEAATDQLSETYTVLTHRDPAADFTSYRTFFLSDTITYINDNPFDSILTGTGASNLAASVRSELENRGYGPVPLDSAPDLAVQLTIIENTSYYSAVYPVGSWWGAPGYFDPFYYGYNYPYAYGYYVQNYSVSSGAVICELVDLKNANQQQELRIIWEASLLGAFEGSENYNINRAIAGFRQAIQQSPYLRR